MRFTNQHSTRCDDQPLAYPDIECYVSKEETRECLITEYRVMKMHHTNIEDERSRLVYDYIRGNIIQWDFDEQMEMLEESELTVLTRMMDFAHRHCL